MRTTVRLFTVILFIFANACLVKGQVRDTVSDIDGNQYPTLVIGNQVWMKENLRTSRYNDGTPIPLVADNRAWSYLKSGAFCWYANDSASYNIPYGKLYNWHAVQTGKLCPSGWHVPSDFELADLTEYLGGKEIAGGKLKERGFTHWRSPNKDATNETGFTSVPSGYRNASGLYYYLGYFDYWWSSTARSSGSAWYWYVYFDIGYIYRDKDYLEMGHAVRCIKD